MCEDMRHLYNKISSLVLSFQLADYPEMSVWDTNPVNTSNLMISLHCTFQIFKQIWTYN